MRKVRTPAQPVSTNFSLDYVMIITRQLVLWATKRCTVHTYWCQPYALFPTCTGTHEQYTVRWMCSRRNLVQTTKQWVFRKISYIINSVRYTYVFRGELEGDPRSRSE